MSERNKKARIKLELDRILEMLAERASSEAAKACCLSLEPLADKEEVELLQAQTTTACRMATTKGTPSFQDVKNVADALARADRGGSLSTMELLRIAGVLRCSRNVKHYTEEESETAALDPFFNQLIPNRYLEDKITNAIVSEEEIADTASPALADIRRHMKIQSARVRESLQKIISSPAYSKYLREPIITIRSGRYVVPVKSEFKNEVAGLIHDVSSTGSTFFVEPMSAVNANNALRELEIKEQKEIERILAELSADVAAYRETIEADYHALVELDIIFAKAKLSFDMRAGEPIIRDDGQIDLRKARHPLIDRKTVVPTSVSLGKEFDTLIITGPNTGGKTVTLKTIGLLTLMAECGLHIPAESGSSLSVFRLVLADIGDEQSIAQSLSTFSSHMKNIVEIISECDSESLVLFDELGAGTDPAEGAALAIALIEFCRKMGTKVAATTHYAELKLYAMRTKGVINASCEFDVETLQPTYRLLVGIPGKSNAFAISRRLGLSEDIIKEARDMVSQNDLNFEDVLSQLEQQRQQMEAAKREAQALRAETEQIKKQSEEYNEQIKKEREKAVQKARQEAQSIIEEARATTAQVYDELKQLRKQMKDACDVQGINQRQTELRRALNEAEDKLGSKRKEIIRPKASREIRIGDTVELLKLGTRATVLECSKDGSFLLQAGIMKVKAKPDEVYLIENQELTNAKKFLQKTDRQLNNAAAVMEVDLRGMDSVEAICVLQHFVDNAFRNKVPSIRIIHGKGTGVLRAAVQADLKKNKQIKNFRLGTYGEGEDGVTIAEFY